MVLKSSEEERQRLFEEAHAGSSRAMDRLIHLLRPLVYRKAKRFVEDRQPGIGPSTLTQTVSVKLTKAIRQARQSGNATLMKLVNTIVRNTGISAFRHAHCEVRDGGRHVSLEDVESQVLDGQPGPDEQLASKQRGHRLLVQIAQLSVRQRIALEARLAGESPTEIAARLDCKESEVASILHRAKQNLQHTDESLPPTPLTAALLSCLHRVRAGAKIDESLLARDYPKYHEELRDFLQWLEEVRKLWDTGTAG
ncbi:MAG: sigma-70 family RNA polymerase sigma factor [Polyangia bacterium]